MVEKPLVGDLYIMIRHLFIFIILVGFSEQVYSQKVSRVSSQSGNILMHYDNGDYDQVTSKGIDCNPLLSPDKSIIVFQRRTRDFDEEETHCWYTNPQLWMYDIESKDLTLLVDTTAYLEDPKLTLAYMHDLQFSPDGQFLYFGSEAWETSGSVHKISVRSLVEQFVTDANTFEVIQEGDYAGYLLVIKHRYFPKGGSYDHYWLVNSDGEILDSLGSSRKSACNFLGIEYIR